MAHNVETMYYVSNEKNGRFVPWHGLGVAVPEALLSAEALKMSGLDWTVEQKPVFVENREVPNYKANTRSSDNSVLGIVTDRYTIVQNADAFAFTDALLGEGVRYETAGSLKNGKTVWLLAQMPKSKILGDDVANFLVFTNSHDGTGAVKVALTPTRVVCNNTLNLALSQAKRCWTTRHIGDMQGKLTEAQETLRLATSYVNALSVEAERLAKKHISYAEVQHFLDELFPEKDLTDRQKANAKKAKEEIAVCYFAPDLANFVGTQYGLINAVADWCDHATPARQTEDYANNNWARIMNGHPVLDRAYAMVDGD